jgi:membrane protease YdiL (CAAX protease family)
MDDRAAPQPDQQPDQQPDPVSAPGDRPSPLPGAPLPGTPTAYDPYAWGRAPKPIRPSPPWMQHPADWAPRWGIGDIFFGIGAFLLASVVFAIPGVVVALSEAERPEDAQVGGFWALLALVGSWSGLLLVLLWASRRKGFGTFARDFGFRFRWVDPILGFAIGFVTLLATGLLADLIARLFDDDPVGNAETIFAGQEANTAGLVAMGIAAAIGAPIVEELFFRGLALRAIERRYGAVVGVIGSTILFTLPHYQGGSAVSVISLFAVIGSYALVLAVLTRLIERLGPAVFAHMTINGLGVAVHVYGELFR